MLSPNPSSVQIYSEIAGEYFEASDTDVEEFAKRIGINLETEPYLKYLAEEGLQEALPPEWKPCKDCNKKAWYYYNTETRISQWEHPLNEVYRNKVITIRQDMAMNRIQSIDLSKPPKSLPPLKKLGTTRPPSGITRLGPIGSSTPNVNVPVYNNNVYFGGNDGDGLISGGGSLGDLRSKVEKDTLQNPSSRIIKKPTGLLLTGDGANFLKGADGPAKSNIFDGKSNASNSNLNGLDDAPQNSLKSILTSSTFNQSKKGSVKDKNFEPCWELSPDYLTEQEKNILETIGVQQKPGVKFQLDENTDLKFDISADENDESEVKRVSKSEKSEDSESDDESSEVEEDISESLPGRMKERDYKTTASLSLLNRGNVSNALSIKNESGRNRSDANERKFGAGEKASHSNMSEAATEVMKAAMRDHMESKIKEYQNELDNVRRKREEQIKKHMDVTVEEMRLEKEQLIKRSKQDFEQQKNHELDKVKRDLQSMIKSEVEKLKQNFENELEKKKGEIRDQHENAMEDLAKGYEYPDAGDTMDVLQRKHSEETLKLHSELKSLKDTLREDQKKQIEQMKDYHKTFIEKLKADLKAEETRLQKDHQLRIAEIVKTYELETVELQKKLKTEQDSTLKQLMVEFEKEKVSVEKELREGILSLSNDLNNLKSRVEEASSRGTTIFSEENKSSAQKLSNDDELKTLNSKYHQLEKKYNYLKKELRKLSSANTTSTNNIVKSSPITETSTRESTNLNVSASKSEPRNLNMQQENEVPESVTELAESTSESQSESTFYPSSSVNRPADHNSEEEGNSQMKEILIDNNDRLSDALKSLEVLKSQILDIKQDRESSATTPSSKTLKASSSSGPSPRNSKKTVPQNSPAPTPRIAKKKSTNNNQYQTNTKILKKNLTPSRNGLRSAKSTPELPGLVEDSEESNEIVKEAKEFIRSQKERLTFPNAKFDRSIGSTWSSSINKPKGLRYSLDELSYPPGVTHRPLSKPNDMYSETESSGVGSMRDLKSREKKQISKDIEAICSSLSHLDDQMRLMWSVVQGNPQDKTNSLINLQNNNNVIPSLPNTAKLSGRKSYSGIHPSTPPFDLQSFATSCLSPNNRAIIDTLKATNLPAGVTPSNLLTSLDRDLKKFKETKERILNQFSLQKNTPSDSSIQEKTKDLREWLEKF